MLTLEEIKVKLADRNLKEVSRRTGISYARIYNLATERTEMTYTTVKTISDYLEQEA